MGTRFTNSAWLAALMLLLAACGSTPQVTQIDLTEARGLYVLVYALDPRVRLAAEDQLVADLQARNMTAYPSQTDLAELSTVTATGLAAAARARQAAAVLVLNQVTADGRERVVGDPARISPEHPDLQSFFAHARAEAAGMPDPSVELLAEANLFLLQYADPTLFWSGAAMTRAEDGPSGLTALSQQIADALERAQRQLLGR